MQPTSHARRVEELAELVDLERYPIHDAGSEARRAVVARCREELTREGCARLPGLMRPAALVRARAEAAELEPRATFQRRRVNPYSTAGDPGLPPDHPLRHFMERSNGFVTKEEVPEGFGPRRLYHSEVFRRFVADCLEEPEVHEYADPLAGFVINVLRPGCQQEWHYDTNEFVVSLMTQAPEAGGEFLYCPHIRSPEGENYDDVRRVLQGEDRSRVRRLALRPGDLQLFRGRYSLHRVTRVAGGVSRHTCIFSYARQPGVVGRVERSLALYGKAYPVHYEAERARRRRDAVED